MATVDGTWTYSYDSDGQLVHAAFASTNSAIPSQDLTYVYNAAGDRTQTIVNGVTTHLHEQQRQRIHDGHVADGTTTYTYNANGDLVSMTDSSGTTTYTYDSLNRLVSVTSPTDSWVYEYDALGNLVATIHNGQTTDNLVDPTGLGNVVGQYTSSGSLIAGYTYGLGLVSQVTPGGTNYYQFDALGSTVGLTNAASGSGCQLQLLAVRRSAREHGERRQSVHVRRPVRRLERRERARRHAGPAYDPTTGQFVSNDPIGLRGRGHQSSAVRREQTRSTAHRSAAGSSRSSIPTQCDLGNSVARHIWCTANTLRSLEGLTTIGDVASRSTSGPASAIHSAEVVNRGYSGISRRLHQSQIGRHRQGRSELSTASVITR